KAKQLNQPMKPLKTQINKKQQINPHTTYLNPHTPLQPNYNSPLNYPSQIIPTTQPPHLNKHLINTPTQTIKTPQNNLNPQSKLP
ncbi:hypothetical protein, partial [Staphylococcus epidermidis]|uniref:hypothetical protein n=1 Tax=Staphylococcus epidermidis TaxID=1282 RepID=UPI001C92CD12